MTDYLKTRNSLQTKLKKILDKIQKHSTTPITNAEALILFERVNSTMVKIEAAHEALIQVCKDEDAIKTQENAYDAIETQYQEARVGLHKIMEEHGVAAGPQSTSGTSIRQQKVRLPALELPYFDGGYDSWTSFKDLFDASIGKNSELTDAQKLQYLKAAVKNDAATLIKTLQITNSNYREAWDLLNARYDNQREIVSSVLERLFGPKDIKNESPQELQFLLDNARECIRTLKVLKRPAEHWDDVLVHFYVKKVDPETRKQWAIQLSGNSIPTFEDLTKFLDNHIRGLLASGGAHTKPTAGGRADRRQVTTHHVSSDPICALCKGPHPVYKCSEFNNKSPTERCTLVKKFQLCFNCLKKDHRVLDCRSTSKCRKCSRRHHTMVHTDTVPAATATRETTPQSGGTTQAPGGSSKGSITSGHIVNEESETQVLLSTALARVMDRSGQPQLCRLLLDTGSQGTFITEACTRRLGLRREWSKIPISGISSASAGTSKGKVHVKLESTCNNLTFDITAHVLPKITGTMPRYTCKNTDLTHVAGLKLADPTYNQPGQVDILLGADYVATLMREGRRTGPPLTPIAQETILGWVMSGRVGIEDSPPLYTFHTEMEDVDSILRKFWEVEEPPHKQTYLTAEERHCEDFFASTFKRDDNGRFIVQLPFNKKKEKLGESRARATQRLQQVETRLQRKPEVREAYNKFMREYEALGHMELIPPEETGERVGETNYLPHHFVVNESSTTTKLRVVFDGSAQSSTGVSLNDTMMTGPTLQDDLFDIMIRYRFWKVVLKADMKHMFRNFWVTKSDADMQRIVWRERPEDPIKEYRLRTITYGTKSATYESTKCLEQLANENKEKYPAGSAAMKKDTLVDDAMTGGNSTSDVIEIFNQLKTLAGTAGISLAKCSTNDPDVLTAIPPECRETELLLGLDKTCNIKALGVQWNPASDTFHFKVGQKSKPISKLTKRALLSEIAKVFDPLGLITPVTIRGKILLQELWKLKMDWDDNVPEEIHQLWIPYSKDLKLIENLSIPRWVSRDNACRYELHGFSDASEKAYGAVIYLRTIPESGEATVHMVTSKSRVSPLKQMSLPKLELLAALELAKLIQKVKSILNIECKVVCWSDSTIALTWIAGEPQRWKTFVANQVAKIQARTEPSCWRHVPGIQNPADIVSRGISSDQLIASSFWWHGPEWLKEDQLPAFTFTSPTSDTVDMDERKKKVVVHHTQLSNLNKPYSSLLFTQRVTVYVIRFANMILRKQQIKKGPPSAEEMHHALKYLIKEAQAACFPKEVEALQSKQQISQKSRLKTLTPYINNDGIICVGGRLIHAKVPERMKHQIILPHNHHFTTLLIQHYHHSYLHAGFQATWSALQRRFWILRGRDTVRHHIRKCVTCRRHRATHAEQIMGNLPSSRVNITRPFLNTGVDYCGPFLLRNMKGRKSQTYKAYLAVFVCMATKAVHLEAVSDMSTDAFIATFRRYAARSGVCANMYSDNGSNFIGADVELRRLFKNEDFSNRMTNHLSSQGTNWHFIAPSSPHHGGLWEAAVKSAKFHLKRVIGNSMLTFESFQTLLCQVEAVLNSRPLTPMSSDPTDLEVLTPGHFLIGEALTAIPDDDLSGINSNRLSLWQQQQQRVQHFWKRWSAEYLATLQQRQKWLRPKENVMVGDLVLLKEDNIPPARWKMGRIIHVHPGEDGHVRVATVKTSTTDLQRPVIVALP